MGIAWNFRTQKLSSLLFSQPLSQKGLEFVWNFGWYCNNKNKYYGKVVSPTSVWMRMRSWEIGRFLVSNKQTKQNTNNLGAFCFQRRRRKKIKRRRKGRERKRKLFPSLSFQFNFSLVSLPGSFYFGTVQTSPSSGSSLYARDYQEFFFFSSFLVSLFSGFFLLLFNHLDLQQIHPLHRLISHPVMQFWGDLLYLSYFLVHFQIFLTIETFTQVFNQVLNIILWSHLGHLNSASHDADSIQHKPSFASWRFQRETAQEKKSSHFSTSRDKLTEKGKTSHAWLWPALPQLKVDEMRP